MQNEKIYDTIIIGSGVTGLGAAWYLTETLRKETLLLEQFPFPHQFGSSAGHSRITRHLYKDYFNCNLMKEATTMWKDLEIKTNIKENGLIAFGTSEETTEYINAINISGISAHLITENEVKEKFPAFSIPSDYTVIYDPNGGVLRADKCLQALLKRSLECGLVFREMEKVNYITVISNDEVHVSTNFGIYKSKSIIIASGIWSKQLLENLGCNLPLEPVKIHYSYFDSKCENLKFSYDNFPSFVSINKNIYGCSGMEFPGCVKIGDHTYDPIINPNKIDSDENQCQSIPIFLKNVQIFLENIIPSVDRTPVKIATCVILRTPDEQPIIDSHPKFKNVVIGCGFCGTGFKTGVIHGKLLANLASNIRNEYVMDNYSLMRF